jgi:hypothetical protein
MLRNASQRELRAAPVVPACSETQITGQRGGGVQAAPARQCCQKNNQNTCCNLQLLLKWLCKKTFRFHDFKFPNMNWPNKRRATVAASPLRPALSASSKGGGAAAVTNASLSALGEDLTRSRLSTPNSQALRFVRPDKESLRKLILRCLLNALQV